LTDMPRTAAAIASVARTTATVDSFIMSSPPVVQTA
jgi:hypothetical protein